MDINDLFGDGLLSDPRFQSHSFCMGMKEIGLCNMPLSTCVCLWGTSDFVTASHSGGASVSGSLHLFPSVNNFSLTAEMLRLLPPHSPLASIHTEWVGLWYGSQVGHRPPTSRQERKTINAEEGNLATAREGGDSEFIQVVLSPRKGSFGEEQTTVKK